MAKGWKRLPRSLGEAKNFSQRVGCVREARNQISRTCQKSTLRTAEEEDEGEGRRRGFGLVRGLLSKGL